MKPRKLLVSLCCVITYTFLISSVFAQSYAQFAKANQEYADHNFKEAIDGYDQLVRSGQWSANLFYDLGNAYFRVGDFGHAILNYERALALDRHHPEADANLRIARDEARALEMQLSWPERYFQFGSLNQYSLVAAVAFWLGMFCVFRLIFGRRRSAAIITLSILSFSTFVIAAFATYKLDTPNNGRVPA